MQFSQKTEYALHALFCLGKKEEAVLVDDIADKLKVSESYLAKVLQKLSRAGLVQGLLGPGGGYKLAKSPAEITVAEVVELFEKEDNIIECNYRERGCSLYPDCRIITVLEAGFAEMLDSLEQTTIQDFICSNLKQEGAKNDLD